MGMAKEFKAQPERVQTADTENEPQIGTTGSCVLALSQKWTLALLILVKLKPSGNSFTIQHDGPFRREDRLGIS